MNGGFDGNVPLTPVPSPSKLALVSLPHFASAPASGCGWGEGNARSTGTPGLPYPLAGEGLGVRGLATIPALRRCALT